MLPRALIKGFDKRRLRNLLLLFFLALAVPTAVLVKQAYSQLKWEAFHQYRGQAEELVARIDARLIDMINTEDARSFSDYSFLVVTGDPAANFLQRSPLSAYPVTNDIPGSLGYFQVDASGSFSSPILPPQQSDRRKLAIDDEEHAERQQVARRLQSVLADNRLVRSRPESRSPAAPKPVASRRPAIESEMEAMEEVQTSPGSRKSRSASGEFAVSELVSQADERPAANAYTQEVFDRLNIAQKDKSAVLRQSGTSDFDEMPREDDMTELPPAIGGKAADVGRTDALEKKSPQLKYSDMKADAGFVDRADAPARSRFPRKEQSAVPETVVLAGSTFANFPAPGDLRISTFESEIDPMEFSLLDSGHFVLFRKVWRDGERHIQGLVLDQASFLNDIISSSFQSTALPLMSKLVIAYQDDVILALPGRLSSPYESGNEALEGALLYRSRLSTPLDSIEMIFSITHLPAGPGASVLWWVTIILTVVFAGGFLTLYRLGVSQINLARQQQDFVSAVSHELKTPLTSIRMYGEMLKEGWADEDKKQSYYEFIHDESERLTRLISNVLQLARITRSEPQFDMQPTDASDLMQQIESKIANQVEQAGFTLRFSQHESVSQASINIDNDCFAQIIINLVDNAIKFSRNADNKCIEVSCLLSADNKVLFTVRDYGPGIPRDQMKKIFRLFYRSESELTRETVGTGIGLAIVHQLALAMNGTVDVRNRHPGIEFRIAFPITPKS